MLYLENFIEGGWVKNSTNSSRGRLAALFSRDADVPALPALLEGVNYNISQRVDKGWIKIERGNSVKFFYA